MARTDDNRESGEVPEVPEAQVPGKYHESDESKAQAEKAGEDQQSEQAEEPEPEPEKKSRKK